MKNEIVIVDKILCSTCKNYLGEMSCLAFDKIPNEILFGANDHVKPLQGQILDFVFEPIGKPSKNK